MANVKIVGDKFMPTDGQTVSMTYGDYNNLLIGLSEVEMLINECERHLAFAINGHNSNHPLCSSCLNNFKETLTAISEWKRRNL